MRKRALYIIVGIILVVVLFLWLQFFVGYKGGVSANQPSSNAYLSDGSKQEGAESQELSTDGEAMTAGGQKIVDPRVDVLTHYTNLGIVSNVNNYLNVRENPTTDSMIIGKLLKFGGVNVLEKTDNNWYKVQSGELTGYVHSDFIIMGEEAEQLAIEHATPMVSVTAERLNVRSGPGMEYPVWTQLNSNEKHLVEEVNGDWLKIGFQNTSGYVNKEFVKEGYYLSEGIAWSPITDCSDLRRGIIEYGMEYLGLPYIWGGTNLSTGVDCSGFTLRVFEHFGIRLNRVSKDQIKQGKEIELSAAKPGDLLFYADSRGVIDHVAIYIGDGKILQAAQSIGSVTISKYNYSTEPVSVRDIIQD
ncbi:MAG: SH3 domain-containing protein [Lachnospiraceae bacterium]